MSEYDDIELPPEEDERIRRYMDSIDACGPAAGPFYDQMVAEYKRRIARERKERNE